MYKMKKNLKHFIGFQTIGIYTSISICLC